MTDQQIARYILHIWELCYKKWIRPNINATCQTAVDNRLATVKSAVDAGNVPDMSEMMQRYLKLPDNSVCAHKLVPEQVWSEMEWADAKVEKDRVIGLMRDELAQAMDKAAMVEMHQACIAKLEAEKADMEAVK
jgi:hypothetical protein